MRLWIDVSKGWDVGDSGHPSYGRFAFGSFRICWRVKIVQRGEFVWLQRIAWLMILIVIYQGFT